MKYLFLMFLFDVSGGNLVPKIRTIAVFSTLEDCDKLGRDIAKNFGYEKPGLKSFSTCVPQDAFQTPSGELDTQSYGDK